MYCITIHFFTVPTICPLMAKPTSIISRSMQRILHLGHGFMVPYTCTTVQAVSILVTSISKSTVMKLLYGHCIVLISEHVPQAHCVQSCYGRACHNPQDCNHQQVHFIPPCIQMVEWNVVLSGHQLFEIQHSVLPLFGRSKRLLHRWLQTFLLLQDGWIHWVLHATACIPGTYVVCFINGIR